VVIKGQWCDACKSQLRSISARLSEVHDAGGEVVGLSTEDAGTNRMTMRKLGLAFDVLGDPSARLLQRLGMWLPEPGHAMPGVIFLDTCGDVAARVAGRRPGVSQDALILEILRELSRRRRSCGSEA
jgi:peroxiredoxin